MCKKFSLVRGFVMFAAALTLGFTAASCADDYDDTDLYNRIDELQDDVDELAQQIADLESSLNSQISSILTMINGQVTVTSATLSEDGTYYTIVLSDGTTFDVAVPSEEGEGDADASTSVPVIGVELDSNGNYYWTLDGSPLVDSEGNYIYTTPLVQINTETNELEISTDGGTSWIGTGVYATTYTSLFSSVEVDETLGCVNFTLSDGTVIQVPLVSDSSAEEETSSTQANCYALSGKQYFDYEETKTVKLSVSGVSKATVTRPDGWKASVSGSTLSITAPAEANTYAEQEGTVTVIAIGSDGTTAITDVNVAIGTAPIEITMTADTIDFAFSSTEWSYYTYGVLKLNSLDEFDPETIASELEEGYPYTYDSDYSTTFADEYIDVEAGYVYVAYALCCDYMWWSYTFDDAANMVYEVYIPINVTGEVVSTTFEDAVISIEGSGLETVYWYMTEKDYWYDGEYFISDVNGYYGYTKDVNYSGSLLDYSGWTSLDAGETYIIALMAYEEGKYDYTVDDIIFTMEVTLNDYTYDGTATVTIGEVEATTTTIKATITPGDGVYKYSVVYLSATNAATYNTSDQAMIQYLQTYGTKRDGTTSYTLSKSSLNPDTAGYIFAVALDENGAYGPLVTVEANTLAVTFNTDITISAEATDLSSLNSVTFTLGATGGSVVSYRYQNMTSSVWSSNSTYGKDDETAANYLATHTASPVRTVTASSLTDGQLTVTSYSYGSSLVAGSSYVLSIIGIDANGLPTAAVHVEYTVGSGASYIRSIVSDGSANPDYTACELTLTADDVEYEGASDDEYQAMPDYDTWYDLVETNTLYGYARVYVDLTGHDNIKQVYVYINGSDYITTTAWTDRIGKVITSSGSKNLTASGYAVSNYIRLPLDLTVFYTWQDTDGNWYESKTLTVVEDPDADAAE